MECYNLGTVLKTLINGSIWKIKCKKHYNYIQDSPDGESV